MEKNEKIILAFVAGAVVGAGLGLLFAPDKGSETRKMIKDGAEKLADSIKEKTEQGLEAITGLKEKVFHSGNGNGKTGEVL